MVLESQSSQDAGNLLCLVKSTMIGSRALLVMIQMTFEQSDCRLLRRSINLPANASDDIHREQGGPKGLPSLNGTRSECRTSTDVFSNSSSRTIARLPAVRARKLFRGDPSREPTHGAFGPHKSRSWSISVISMVSISKDIRLSRRFPSSVLP